MYRRIFFVRAHVVSIGEGAANYPSIFTLRESKSTRVRRLAIVAEKFGILYLIGASICMRKSMRNIRRLFELMDPYMRAFIQRKQGRIFLGSRKMRRIVFTRYFHQERSLHLSRYFIPQTKSQCRISTITKVFVATAMDRAKTTVNLRDLPATSIGDCLRATTIADRLRATMIADRLRATMIADSLRASMIADRLRASMIADSLRATMIADSPRATMIGGPASTTATLRPAMEISAARRGTMSDAGRPMGPEARRRVRRTMPGASRRARPTMNAATTPTAAAVWSRA